MDDDGEFAVDEAPRDLVVPFPEWKVDSEEARFLTEAVATAAADVIGQIRHGHGPAEQLAAARGLGPLMRDRLAGAYLVGAHSEAWALVDHLNDLASALTAEPSHLDRYAEQLRFYRELTLRGCRGVAAGTGRGVLGALDDTDTAQHLRPARIAFPVS